MSTTDVEKVVTTFAERLREQKFPFSGIYLFGSYAKGTAREWSDLDVCVISDRFAGKDWDEQERQLWRWTREVDSRIEPLGMSPEEFASEVSPMAHEVKTTGIKIA